VLLGASQRSEGKSQESKCPDVVRVTGDYVSLAGLKLFQIEPEPDGREGVQSTSGVLRTRLLNCAPSPFSRMAAVSYELGQAGSVELTVRDVSGRLVRRLESGYRLPALIYDA